MPIEQTIVIQAVGLFSLSHYAVCGYLSLCGEQESSLARDP